MSEEKQPITAITQFADAAKQELVDLARQGMAEKYHAQHDFEVVAYGTKQKFRDSIFSLLPREVCNQYSRCKSGVFAGLGLQEILSLCFTEEAVDFLIKHAYNDYLFWHNVHTVVFSFFRKDEVSLPYTLELVKERILDEHTPFGMTSSPYSDLHMGRLKAAAQAAGGQFDPNKLDAPYAYELIRAGFLLRQKLEDYTQPSVLVVNPMWEHLLTDINPSTDSFGPAKTATLVAYGAVRGNMTIELQENTGYTVAGIAQALSQRQLQVVGKDIVRPAIPPAEGHTVIARILDGSGKAEPSTPVWTVVR